MAVHLAKAVADAAATRVAAVQAAVARATLVAQARAAGQTSQRVRVDLALASLTNR